MKKAAIIALLNSENKILLQLRDNKPDIHYPNSWGFIGGGVEEGESELEAVKREIGEEINCEIDPIEKIGEIYHPDRDICVHIFKGRLDKSPKEIKLSEGQEVKFFDLADIPNTKMPEALKRFLIQNPEKFHL